MTEEQTPTTHTGEPMPHAQAPVSIKPGLASYAQFVLPAAILLAALIVAGSLLYTRGGGSSGGYGAKGKVQIGDGQPVAPVDVKVSDSDHVLGNKNAKVTVIEFADFRCPFCERFYQQAEGQLLKEYVNTGKARFIFKHYAFLGPQSTWASEAAECAAEQGKFWEYHNWLYNNQAPESNLAYYSKANLTKYAGQVSGINTGQFAACLNSDKYASRVSADLSQGQAAGVTGTPTVFINGQKIVGAQPYASFKAVIDGFLK